MSRRHRLFFAAFFVEQSVKLEAQAAATECSRIKQQLLNKAREYDQRAKEILPC